MAPNYLYVFLTCWYLPQRHLGPLPYLDALNNLKHLFVEFYLTQRYQNQGIKSLDTDMRNNIYKSVFCDPCILISTLAMLIYLYIFMIPTFQMKKMRLRSSNQWVTGAELNLGLVDSKPVESGTRWSPPQNNTPPNRTKSKHEKNIRFVH